jgi:hypothetical protein
MTDRLPTLGDWDNGYDNTITKNIDIWTIEMDEIQNTISATEWFAELVYAGGWSINPDWQKWWDYTHPTDPPVDPPAEPPVESESIS